MGSSIEPSSDRTSHVGERSVYASGDLIAQRYELIEPLGEGGMGVVWIAHALHLDVRVAVKLLRGTLAGTEAVERMAIEARAAAKLGHSAMARVFDFGSTESGDPFIVMELLHGESLRTLLERQVCLDAITAVRMLLPIADVLAIAHAKGIVHRDIKPGNVFIADDDRGRMQPKLLDFGVAKLEEHTGNQSYSKLTGLGVVLGSPDYLSPEQARGLTDIDERSDVWAFCVMLYECICGRPPFVHPNYNALLHRIVTEEPKPCTEYSAGDPQLWEILARGFEKDRALRWQSMRELGTQLAHWLIERDVNEDICSNSLRTFWLDAESSKVRRQRQPSYSGEEHWLPKVMVRRVSDAATQVRGQEPETTQPATVGAISETRSRPRNRLWLVGAAAALVLALVIFWAFPEPHPPEDAAIDDFPAPRALVPEPPPDRAQRHAASTDNDNSGPDALELEDLPKVEVDERSPPPRAPRLTRPAPAPQKAPVKNGLKTPRDVDFGF